MTLSFSISVEIGGQRISVGPHGVQGNAKGVHVQTGQGRTSIHINPGSRRGHSRSPSFSYTTSHASSPPYPQQQQAHAHPQPHAFTTYGHQSQSIPHAHTHNQGQRPAFAHRPDSYDHERDARRRAAEERLHAASQRSRTHNEQHARERDARRHAAEARLREAEERARLKAEEHARAARRAEREREKAMERAARAEQERRERLRLIKDTWVAYDAQGASPPPRLKFRTILWPVLTPPSRAPPQAPGAPPVVTGLTREALREFLLAPVHSAGVSERARVHAALRRWHPDKMGRVLERVVERDRAAVEEGVRIVAGELAALLKEVSEARRA